MEADGSVAVSSDPSMARRRTLRSYRDRAQESDSSDGEHTANSPQQLKQVLQTLRRSSRTLPEGRTGIDQRRSHSYSREQSSDHTDTSTLVHYPLARGRGSRRNFNARGRRRGGSSSGTASPVRTDAGRRRSSADNNNTRSPVHELRFDAIDDVDEVLLPVYRSNDLLDSPAAIRTDPTSSLIDSASEDLDDYSDLDGPRSRLASQFGGPQSYRDDSALNTIRFRPGAMKRSRDKFENMGGKDVIKTLNKRGAVAVMLYRNGTPDPCATDVWPSFRDSAKLPAKYYLLNKNAPLPLENKSRRRTRNSKPKRNTPELEQLIPDELPDAPTGRPKWNLPTELVELIASYLNRDDIKSMRLVSQELNRHVSQVIFKHVVVPFNTEIYGMLGQEQEPDLKGKKNKVGAPSFPWKNANGDDVYNGHGLDVFRGFGRHILKYGMSFEVNEDSLAKPPVKLLTKRHTSFWGSYYWPFEEYRRFEDVAGLEAAADETPRMKIAFSELTQVRELALSLDSGLGWLNGPDRSIRGRILQKPPAVWGTLKEIPDRKAQAQKELWEYVKACHRDADSDVRLATLYKMEAPGPLSELQEANLPLEEQPGMPYLDPHLIHEAVPYDTADIEIPISFDDPEVLERFVLAPSPSKTGILFSSTRPPTSAEQLMSSIIPSHLTEAQREWLLEIEWAQRAFLSSYMLAVIDNPKTFDLVHSLNISQLSDRYLPMLDRVDFWSAFPSLRIVNLLVIPGWRTVHKHQSGFVETPDISPSSGIDSFYNLLGNIGSHQNIKKLTFGWATGGELAEGVHARNRLLLPAPLTTTNMITDQNAATLKQHMVPFQYVEELTLKNCWISPPALLQFVKMHDDFKLKHLTLQSVSLTAVLRPFTYGPQLNQQGLGVAGNVAEAFDDVLFTGWNAQNNPNVINQIQAQAQQNQANPGQTLQAYIQRMQLQIQQMQPRAGAHQRQIAQLQAHLQHQIQLQNQQGQQQVHGNHPHWVAPLHQATPQLSLAPMTTQSDPHAQSVLRREIRQGSWVNMIDIISPGPNLSDFGSVYSQADAERSTSLQSIEFISCGYARLPHAPFYQTPIEPPNGHQSATRNTAHKKRYNFLAPVMLSSKSTLLGEIVQEVDVGEFAILNAGWDLVTGWKDEEEARAVEFDGLLPGGTGRFTGIVRAEDRVVEASAS